MSCSTHQPARVLFEDGRRKLGAGTSEMEVTEIILVKDFVSFQVTAIGFFLSYRFLNP